jgi:hypothetical protein
MQNFEDIATRLAEIESELNDMVLETVQEQLMDGNKAEAAATERQLSKARRSLAKCISTLRGAGADESGD